MNQIARRRSVLALLGTLAVTLTVLPAQAEAATKYGCSEMAKSKFMTVNGGGKKLIDGFLKNNRTKLQLRALLHLPFSNATVVTPESVQSLNVWPAALSDGCQTEFVFNTSWYTEESLNPTSGGLTLSLYASVRYAGWPSQWCINSKAWNVRVSNTWGYWDSNSPHKPGQPLSPAELKNKDAKLREALAGRDALVAKGWATVFDCSGKKNPFA